MPLVTPTNHHHHHMQGADRITLDDHSEHESSGTPFDEWDLNQYDCDLEPIQWASTDSCRNDDEHYSLTPSRPSNDTQPHFAAPWSCVSKAVQFRDARCLVSQTPIHLRAIQRNLLATLSRNTQEMATVDQAPDDKEECSFLVENARRTTAGHTDNHKITLPKLKLKPTRRTGSIQSSSVRKNLHSYSHLEDRAGAKDHRTIYFANSFDSGTIVEGADASPSPYKPGGWYDFDYSQQERPISPLLMTTTDQDLFDCGTRDSGYDKPTSVFHSGGGPSSATFPHNLEDFGPEYSNNYAASRLAPPPTFPRPTKSKQGTTPRIARAEKSTHTARTACIKYRYYRTTKAMAQSFLLRHFSNNNEMTLDQLASLPRPPGREVAEP